MSPRAAKPPPAPPPNAPELGYVAWIVTPLPPEPGDKGPHYHRALNPTRGTRDDGAVSTGPEYYCSFALLDVLAKLYRNVGAMHARWPELSISVRLIAACPQCAGDYPFATCPPGKGCGGKQVVRDYGEQIMPLSPMIGFLLSGKTRMRRDGM